MHAPDALLSPVVAGMGYVVATTLLTISLRKSREDDNAKLPLMGVLAAFILVVQMLNIAIPGTGASGHMVGGIFLAALLGPWSAFLVLSAVLILQCLLLGDGGLLALGCNILNMAACASLVVYPLVFKPLMRYPASLKRLFCASIFAGVVAMELSALLLSLEMIISGVAPLRAYLLLLLMLSIHLIIGVLEGIMTALLLYFIQQQRPTLLEVRTDRYVRTGWVILSLVLITLLIAFVVRLFTSSQPDGMEWSVEHALAAPWNL